MKTPKKIKIMIKSKIKRPSLPLPFLILILILILISPASAADITRISALLTITNAPTTNGQTLTVNSSTRTWTNNTVLNPAIYILTNSTVNGSTTNLFLHLAQYRFVSSLNVTYADTNALRFQAAVNQPLSVSVGGSWASVTYSTQLVSTPFTVPVRVPFDVENSTNRVTIADLTVRGLNDFATAGRGWTNWFLRDPTFSGTFGLAGPQNIVATVVTTNAAITTNDLYLAVDSSANTVLLTLPTAASSSNTVWIVHDDGGAAASFNITITNATGNDRINGATSYVMNRAYEGATIISRGGTNFYVYAEANHTLGSIARSAIAAGTANHVVINDGSGNLSSEATLGATRFPALTGDVTTAGGSLSTTIAANSVALTTDTTGNYVADVVGTANEITSSHTPAEGSTATLSLPATIDLGGKTSFELPNAAAPTVDAFGEIAGDNNLWDTGRGAPVFFDGTAAVALVGALVSDTPSNGQIPTWNTGGTITWENAPGAAGGDSVTVDGAATIDPNFDDGGDIDFAYSAPDITATVKANAVALTTDTTGNYAAGDAEAGGATLIRNAATDTALSAAGEMALNTTDEQLSFHSAADGEISGEVALSLIQHRAWSFDPDAVCDGAVDRLFLMTVGDQAPEGLVIVEWKVSFEADPTTEADLDLKYADAFIGVANSAVIDVLDTTAGVSSEDTNANINGGAAIANGKVLYLEFGTAYTETTHQIIFEMWFYAEED